MTEETRGPFDASDPDLIKALDEANREAEQATRRRAEARCKPGFFVVPIDLLDTRPD